jgi:hypothetical protein
MWLPLLRRSAAGNLASGTTVVPGRGAVYLSKPERWRLAGEYASTHRLIGPWYGRRCATCDTRGRCDYARWADEVIVGEARREWLGG